MRPAELDHDNAANPSLLGLRVLWLELTDTRDAGPTLSLDVPDYFRVLDQGREMGCRAVQFIGEDAVRHPGLPRLLAHARAAGYQHLEVCADPAPLPRALLDCFAAHRVAVLLVPPRDAPLPGPDPLCPPGSLGRMLRRLAEAGIAARVGPRPALDEWAAPYGVTPLRPVGTVADASLALGAR